MCRVFGYFNAARTDLTEVALLQRAGGPDRTTVCHGDRWGIGSNRLAVMAPEGGQQPYTLGPDSGIRVVFNGELYNHDELRKRLERRGHRFDDRCDGNVLPALYQEYGEDFTDHLEGMYAVAILDTRSTPVLVLATDHAGMKPLYYRYDSTSGAVYFSSELPAMLAFDDVPTRLWEPGLDHYLATRTPFGERTMVEGVRVLPPATTAVCRLGGPLRLRSRGDVESPAPPTDEEEAAVVLRETLRREVGRLLVADVPVALIVSGGLDSSLVTALAAERGPVHAFNIAYRGKWPFDERHFAREVADRSGAVFHQVEADPVLLPELLPATVRRMGQPNADPITVSSLVLFRAVREAGYTVALTGDAADEVFGGYARMRQALAHGDGWETGYLDALAATPEALRRTLYTEEYRAELTRYGEDPLPPGARADLLEGPGGPLERMTEFELRHRMPAYHLRRVDHLSMANSVEVRLPYCQPSIMALGRALPDRMRIRDGKVKRALFGAAGGLLPTTVLTRPKQPFTLPITAMLVPGSPLWSFTRDVLSPDALRRCGRLRAEEVTRLFSRQADRPDDTTALTLWALTVYHLWLDQLRDHGAERGVGAPGGPVTVS
ncbi:asparagine synthase (glutamine-hydrolyzing) [Streptomyces sp. ST2-7A]|nr:asparagine synthase (glutamine-hydrolyzing) [Streptomyces sp. ST2-7A]